jgi:ABC-type tungstate transport system permease subunit
MNINNTAKFTFDYTWRDETGEVTSRTRHTTSEETLGEILDAFELFLRGSGFVFNGKLDFVDEETGNALKTGMNQTGELNLFEDKQLEFDFVKELFNKDTKDLDTLDDLDK